LVREALPFVGHFVTRNRGTVGGSIAHADGAAELPLCLVALGGAVVVDGPDGRREIPAEEFFVTHFTTALTTGELVVETVWPLVATGESSSFEELALRAGDFAQSMVAVVLRRSADGTVDDASVAVGAVSDRPIRLREVEALLVGTSGAEAARDAGSLAAALVDPPGSIHASARYLRALTGALTTRAIERAA
jgi:carbon-monoxide dehydrogenase medium subunit